MLKDELHKIIIELCEEVEKILSARIDKYGANPRAHGKNTLRGSSLEESIEVIPQENGLVFKIADYWEYVALGWKKTGRSPHRGLYHALVLWALKKHIRLPNMTENESAVVIAEGTWYHMIMHGREIAPRPFMVYDKEGDLEKMIPELKAYMDKWFHRLFELIISDIDKFFK